MIRGKMSEIIKERIRICNELQDNWGDGIERCWKKALEILSVDIEKSKEYFMNECTDEEFYWLSEIFEEIIDKTQSIELLETFRERLAKVNPENYHQESFNAAFMREYVNYDEYVQDVNQEITYAENWLKE